LLRHRTVSARAASVTQQEFLVLRTDSCTCYLSKGMLPLVDPFLPRPERTGEGHRGSACAPSHCCAFMRASCCGFPGCCLMSRIRNIRWAWGLCTLDVQFPSVLSLDMYDCRARCGFSRTLPASAKECYLVDPASSHMLVSKIKPCMCKYEQIQTVKLRMAH
jgi:hypothetical protein